MIEFTHAAIIRLSKKLCGSNMVITFLQWFHGVCIAQLSGAFFQDVKDAHDARKNRVGREYASSDINPRDCQL